MGCITSLGKCCCGGRRSPLLMNKELSILISQYGDQLGLLNYNEESGGAKSRSGIILGKGLIGRPSGFAKEIPIVIH